MNTRSRPAFDRGAMVLLASGHACADLSQGAVPALLPYLIAARGLSLGAATALLTASSISSSIIQPLFGIWADRLSNPVLLPAGVTLAAIGLGLVGFCGSYAALAASLFVGGIGVAAFHPEGGRTAGRLATRGGGIGKGTGAAKAISIFSVGGNIGFALGPVLVTLVIGLGGLHASPLLALPGLSVGVLFLLRRRRLAAAEVPTTESNTPRETGAAAVRTPPPAAAWGPFVLLTSAAVARTVVFFSLQALVPIYLVEHFGRSKAVGDGFLTGMLVAGAIGTIIGGRLADRFGRRPMLLGAMAALTPIALVLPHVGIVLFGGLLIAIGLTVDGPFSTTVVLGQEYLPGRAGLASGVTLGLAIGVGGLIAAALGAFADAAGLHAALEVLPVFSVIGLVLAARLPNDPADAVAAAAERRRIRTEIDRTPGPAAA